MIYSSGDRDKNPRILTQHARAGVDFSSGMLHGNGIGKGAIGTNANAGIPIVYYETMRARGTILPFYHLFLLAGGCRANGKRYAQETRDKATIQPDSRIPVAINHPPRLFTDEPSNRREVAAGDLFFSDTGDPSRFSNILPAERSSNSHRVISHSSFNLLFPPSKVKLTI